MLHQELREWEVRKRRRYTDDQRAIESPKHNGTLGSSDIIAFQGAYSKHNGTLGSSDIIAFQGSYSSVLQLWRPLHRRYRLLLR